MLLMAEMIFHLTFEHGLKNGAKNLLQDVLYVFRALDVVVVEDLLSNLLAWGSWWSFTLCHSVTVLIFVYPSMGHKVDSCNTDLHKLFYTPDDRALRAAIKNQMRPASCVLILAGVYSTYSKWIRIETQLAHELGKTIIAVEPRGAERTSEYVKVNADVIVRWNTKSIINAIENS